MSNAANSGGLNTDKPIDGMKTTNVSSAFAESSAVPDSNLVSAEDAQEAGGQEEAKGLGGIGGFGLIKAAMGIGLGMAILDSVM